MKIRRVLLRIVQIALGLVGVASFAGVIYATSGAGQSSSLTGLRWTDETPAWSPNGKEIVFASNRTHRGGGIDHLYLMRPDGTHLRRLTRDRLDAREPSFSPDGKQIVFAARVLDGNNHYTEHGLVYLIATNGTHRHWLTPGLRGDASVPAWSPDGRWIAFIDTRYTDSGDSRSDLYVVRPDGTDLHRLAINVDDWSEPFGWAPDSRQIAVVGVDERIYRLGVDATKPVHVTGTTPDSVTTDVAWSPDGREIAYVRGRVVVNNCFCDDDGADIVSRRLWILDLQTHRRRRLQSLVDSGSLGDFGVSVTWLHERSPVLAAFGDHTTVLLTPEGHNVGSMETPNGGMLTLGSASADGRKLLFVDGPDGSYRSAIFLADVRNDRMHAITQGSRS
jgi:Tol biopolymer transport system component